MASEKPRIVRRAKRVNGQQMMLLVKFLTNNPAMIKSPFTGAGNKVIAQRLWEKLARQLAKVGPAKNWIQWRTVWKDFKMRVTKKAALIQNGEGGNLQLSPLEMKVLALVCPYDSNKAHVLPEMNMEDFEFDQVTEATDSPSPPPSPPPSPLVTVTEVPDILTSSHSNSISYTTQGMGESIPNVDSVLHSMLAANTEALLGFTKVVKDVGEKLSKSLDNIAVALRSPLLPPPEFQ